MDIADLTANLLPHSSARLPRADTGLHPHQVPNEAPRRRAEQIGQKTTARVATLNINGFGNLLPDHPDNKWGRIYSMMREERIAILLVQETHLTDRRVADIHQMYAGSVKILHSPHPDAPTQKEGVAVVLNTKLINGTNAQMKVVVPGRAIQVSVAWRGGDVRHLLCVYAPTSEGVNERRAFFKKVLEYYTLHTSIPHPHLMAGDFNNVEDSIDRLPVSLAHDQSIEDLDELKSALNLMIVDGWRATHPSDRHYTFHRGSGEAATMSRLDRIYVNADIFQFARQWEIKQPSIKTDHLLAMVQLSTPNDPEVGPGRTVFPLHLLSNKGLAKKMKARGLEALKEVQALERSGTRSDIHNPQTVLAAMKREWLDMARALEKVTVPKLISDINHLESSLKSLRNDRYTDSHKRAAEINALTAQIRELQAKRQKQRQGNSRAKHRLEGESPTKFWVNLHKPKTPRELIPAFESPEGSGVFVTDASQMAKVAREHHNLIQRDGPDVQPTDVREQDIQTVLDSLDVRISDLHLGDMAALIDHDDCEFALKHSKSGTAPGVDGIQYEVWKTFQERFKEDSRHEGRPVFDVLALLQAAFVDIQQHGVCKGTGFADGWMAPIWKEKGEKTKVVNYRPITVLNTDYKLLTKIMAVKL
ncbi:DNase I-like protein, partial [Trametes coccinea BRFM310]